MYNISYLNQTDGISDIIYGINANSGGFFAIGLLFILFVLILISTKHFETRVSMFVSSVFTLFLSILFWWAGWITIDIIFYPAVLTFASLLWNVLGAD